VISRYVAVKRDHIRLEPNEPEDWRVIRLDSDGDGEYVRSGPRDFCEAEAERLNDLVTPSPPPSAPALPRAVAPPRPR
jgi:hypothetical protein